MKKMTLVVIALSIFSSAQSQPESPWLISGNSGTIPGIHFLGTTDNKPLLFRVNNVPSGEIDSLRGKTFFGFGAGSHITTALYNTGMGYKSLSANTTGYGNSGLGYSTLAANVTGQQNSAIGYLALASNTTGWYNTANGAATLSASTTACCNVANGFGTLGFDITGSYNTGCGFESLYYNVTGVNNTAHGTGSLFFNNGSNNTASGYYSLTNNRSGIWNTAMGTSALSANYAGNYNTAVGGKALYSTWYSSYNTAIGYHAGTTYDMGYNNTMVGAYCDINGVGYYNCIALGEAVTCTAPSQARIGNSSTVSIGGYVGWSNISDGRYKKDIKEEVKGLDFVMKLRPVTYHLDVAGLSKKLNESRDKKEDEFAQKAIGEKEQILFSGFVAQDVEKAAKEVGYDFSGVDKPKNENDLYGLRYAEFVVPLVKAVQELSNQNTALKNQLDELKKANADQKKLNEDLLERIKRLESSFVTKNNK